MILIDMEKPTSCLLCPLSHHSIESPFFDCYCNLLERHISAKKALNVQDDCPIREVKE